jgi:hypothetical protein
LVGILCLLAFSKAFRIRDGCRTGQACWGPRGPYVEVFGSELARLGRHQILGAVCGAVVFACLAAVRRLRWLPISWLQIAGSSVAAAVAAFLLAAYFHPVIVLY